MMNIAGGSMATGQYAKDTSDPLATEVVNLEEETTKKPSAPHEEVAQSTNAGSSGPKPKKGQTKSLCGRQVACHHTCI